MIFEKGVYLVFIGDKYCRFDNFANNVDAIRYYVENGYDVQRIHGQELMVNTYLKSFSGSDLDELFVTRIHDFNNLIFTIEMRKVNKYKLLYFSFNYFSFKYKVIADLNKYINVFGEQIFLKAWSYKPVKEIYGA